MQTTHAGVRVYTATFFYRVVLQVVAAARMGRGACALPQPGCKRVLQRGVPLAVAAESPEKAHRSTARSGVTGHAEGATVVQAGDDAGGDGKLVLNDGEGVAAAGGASEDQEADSADDEQVAALTNSPGEVVLREKAAGACLGGWGPTWGLALHRLQHDHGAGTGVLACGEAILPELQQKILAISSAAAAEAADSNPSAPAAGTGAAMVSALELVAQRMKGDQGASASLADPMVMILMHEHASGDLLSLSTEDGRQMFVVRCQVRELMRIPTWLWGAHAAS